MDYSAMEWNELQAMAKERLGSGAGTREDIEAALRELDDSPTGAAQQARDEQADAAAAGTDQKVVEVPAEVQEMTGTEITEAVAAAQGVEAQGARAEDAEGNVRPADGRWLGDNNDDGEWVEQAAAGAEDAGDR